MENCLDALALIHLTEPRVANNIEQNTEFINFIRKRVSKYVGQGLPVLYLAYINNPEHIKIGEHIIGRPFNDKIQYIHPGGNHSQKPEYLSNIDQVESLTTLIRKKIGLQIEIVSKSKQACATSIKKMLNKRGVETFRLKILDTI